MARTKSHLESWKMKAARARRMEKLEALLAAASSDRRKKRRLPRRPEPGTEEIAPDILAGNFGGSGGVSGQAGHIRQVRLDEAQRHGRNRAV